MKNKVLSIFTFLAMTLLVTTIAHSAQTFIVSGNPYAPPVVWAEQQKLVGLGPDLAASILNELNIPFTIRSFGDWKNVQKKAKEGAIDMIVSAYRNDERSTYLSFSVPYLSQPTVLVVEKGKEFDFSSWESLKGKKGVTSIGESYGQEFDTFSKKFLDIDYLQFERAIQLLNLGEADYLVSDLYTALIYARLLQGEDSISILDPPVTTQNFHFAIRKDSELANRLPEINRLLQEKSESGEVGRILMSHYEKWKRLTDQRSKYLSKLEGERSKEQEDYLKEQDEQARQRIMRTMVDREGLPDAAQ